MQLKRVTNGPGGGATGLGARQTGSGGEAPRRWAMFCKFLGKTGYFNALWITFHTFQSHMKEQNF